MARIRKGKNPRPVAVRWLAVKKRRPTGDGGAANGEPHSVKRVVEFPKPPAEDVISDRIIFEIGGDGLQSSGPRRSSGYHRPDRSLSSGSRG